MQDLSRRVTFAGDSAHRRPDARFLGEPEADASIKFGYRFEYRMPEDGQAALFDHPAERARHTAPGCPCGVL